MIEQNDSNCENKAAYSSEQAARTAITAAAWQHGEDKNRKLKVYHCKDCGLYHLSSDYPDKENDEV